VASRREKVSKEKRKTDRKGEVLEKELPETGGKRECRTGKLSVSTPTTCVCGRSFCKSRREDKGKRLRSTDTRRGKKGGFTRRPERSWNGRGRYVNRGERARKF